jgi:hypothetical protein
MMIRMALGPFLCATAFVHSGEQHASTPAEAAPRAEATNVMVGLHAQEECLMCAWESSADIHGWQIDSENLCDTPEEQEENSCHRCDEAHATHCAAGGQFSGKCGPSCAETLAALGRVKNVQTIVAHNSMTDLIRASEDPTIEINLERSVVQLLGCGQRVVAQVPLATENITSLTDLFPLE